LPNAYALNAVAQDAMAGVAITVGALLSACPVAMLNLGLKPHLVSAGSVPEAFSRNG
jgi:hypothetical protein